MPSRSKKVAREVARLPSIPKELVSLFLTGPMTGEAINAAGLALKKALAEASLNAELSHHLGYEAGADRPELVTNQRNGSTAKSVLTGDGTIRIDAPRDRDGSFEPVLVPKHARRFTGFDNKVTALYARGLTVKVAHVRLCHSRMMFFRAYPRETQEMVFDAHERAFAFFKGACTRGIYDNMKTAVDTIFVGKDRQYNRRFLQMCSHHLVEPVACTPASGWEKGQVENQVGLVRERFFTPRLRVKTYDELNAWLLDKSIAYAKVHRHPERPNQTVWEAFEEERPNLVPYRGRFDGFHALAASVSKTCLVRFDNNKYSVNASAVGRPVEIHAYADRIVIRQDGRAVAEHARHHGRGETIYDPWHYVPVLARKPGALRNGAPFKDWVLPAALERVRRKLAGSDDGDRQMVAILATVLTDGLPAVEAACAQAMSEGVHSSDVIINILTRQRDPGPAATILTPDALKLRHAPTADCARYDQLRST